MSEPEKVTKIVQGHPYHLEVTRGQKGGYGWTISVHAESREKVLQEICILDTQPRTKFVSYSNEKTSDIYRSEHEDDVTLPGE